MNGYLFLSTVLHEGIILNAENKQQASMLFLIEWNSNFFEEWQWESISLRENSISIYSHKRNSIMEFNIVEFSNSENKHFQFLR